MSDKSINIHLIDGKGYIWNADDWYTLRTKYRILGCLIGSLPTEQGREDQTGLPSILLPEEVRLLVEYNIGHISKLYTFGSTHQESESWENNLKKLNKIKKIYAHKRASRVYDLVLNCILFDDDGNRSNFRDLELEISTIKPFDITHFDFTTTFLEEDDQPKMANIILPNLTTDLERIRYKVFKNLWLKGYYITCGMKFGGDFLVYEGDPLEYHAKYIVNCSDCDKRFMATSSRVCATTKKYMVLAKEEGDSVQYLLYHLDENSQNTDFQPFRFLLQQNVTTL